MSSSFKTGTGLCFGLCVCVGMKLDDSLIDR